MLPTMRRDEEEIRTRKYLAMMVRVSGFSHKEIDEALGWCRGTTSQVLSSRIQLKYRHILEILDVCQVATATFWETVYPAMSENGLRWPEVGEEAEANMKAEWVKPGAPPRPARRPTPPGMVSTAGMQQLFQELSARLPQLVAMHEGLPAARGKQPAAAPKVAPKKAARKPVRRTKPRG